MTTTGARLPQNPLLIVFTDEFGSTQQDEEQWERTFASGQASANALLDYKTDIRTRRVSQFRRIVKSLERGGSTLVVKNVGDSLVIRFKPNDAFQTSIVQCILRLHEAWRDLKLTTAGVRVAVHLADSNQVVVDGDLDTFIDELGADELGLAPDRKEQLLAMWPALAAIHVDIFGAPMNRAARLAGLPSKPLFVLSREVVESLGAGMTAEERLASGRGVLNQELSTGFFCSDAVPIPWLKGVDRVRLDQPWWAVELAPRAEGWTLAQESKVVQAVRVLNLEVAVAPSDNLLIDASDEITNFLSAAATCRRYFTDLVFKIERIAKVYDASEERIFPSRATDARWLTENKSYRPLFVVFSGTPNERADTQFRDELTRHGTAYWSLEPVTLQVHRYSNFTARVANLKPSEEDHLGRRIFYLVVFQARREARAMVGGGADSPALFESIPDNLDGAGLAVLAYGILRGDKDGYILLEGAPAAKPEAVLSTMVEVFDYTPGSRAFRNRVAPVRLYSLQLKRNNASPEMWSALRGLWTEMASENLPG